MKLYESLAADIAGQIERGVLLPGDKLPSVRQASGQRGLSISTVLRAYSLLESRGVIESRPQSGFVVRARTTAQPAALAPAAAGLLLSSAVDVSRLVLSTLRTIHTQGAVPLGSP
ncbi:MAG: GntR family transcriptional regulator, partial [Burkholderiaceae bacterium]|nr:GntR family transcriptional regulator [Burkholderiaceae bacterium]